ncbi:hypothetical protein LWI28_001842 [Acer negundo]|uniref:AMP-dependent synthetase/ligase domain-containing protein n=1 Tax=Acer negundo TaxID=4023 RepID=A0AAD5IPQ6_ACENE|nr:hypothetical protein LWI28_001842 [Acer negundo]
MDPNSGFCSLTKTYNSLRPDITLPQPSQPLSITQFIFSPHHSTAAATFESTFLINATTGNCLTYSDLVFQTKSLALCLRKHYSLSKGDVAFILSPHSFQFPILFLSLLSLGVIISPAIPDDSISDINHLVDLSKPTIAFTTSYASYKLPSYLPTVVLIDSPEFLSFFTHQYDEDHRDDVVRQHDGAAIFNSSGTSGPRKGFFDSQELNSSNCCHGQIISYSAICSVIDYACFYCCFRVECDDEGGFNGRDSGFHGEH